MINSNRYFSFSHIPCSEEKDKSFSGSINDARNKFYDYDRKLVTNKIQYNSIFHNESGQFNVELDGYLLQCFYYDNQSNNNRDNSLVVGLNGARLLKQVQEDPNNEYPNFKRWSYYPLNNGCYLNIDDPMFKKFPELLLGWYYGSKVNSALTPVIHLVNEIIQFKTISNTNVKFFSSSGGGYACILSAIMLPGSLSISINPQLYIQNYPYASSFKKITGIDLNEEDSLLRNNLAKNIKKNSKSKHFIIVNTECYKDMKDHLVPFSKEMGLQLRYGLSIKDNILVWCYQACRSSLKSDPHISYETKYIYAVIDYISDQFQKSLLNEKTVELYQPLVLLTNEYWNDYYVMKFNYSQLQSFTNQDKIIFLNNTKKKLANKLIECHNNIHVNANSFNYNCWKLPITNKDSLYTISMSGITLTNETTNFTVAFYVPISKRLLIRRDINLQNQGNEIHFNFLTNNFEHELVFLVYCGIASLTNGIGLNISNVKIFCEKNME